MEFAPKYLKQTAWILWTGVTLAGMGPAVLAGEKIQIIEGSGRTEIPSKSSPDDLFSRPFDFLRSRGDGGGSGVPSIPPPSPKSILRPDLRMENSQEKHWLLNEKGATDDAAIKQLFGVRDYSGGSWDKGKTRPTSIESKWKDPWIAGSRDEDEDKDRKNKPGPIKDPFSSEDPFQSESSFGRGPKPLFQQDRFKPGSADPSERSQNHLLSPERQNDPFSHISSGIARHPLGFENASSIWPQAPSAPGSGFGSYGDPDSKRGFNNHFETPKSYTSELFHPTRIQTDLTRQDLNPVVGRSELPSSGGLGNFPSPIIGAAGPAIPSAISPARLSPMDAVGARGPGTLPNWNNPPASTLPTVMNTRPPVLELPKRKF